MRSFKTNPLMMAVVAAFILFAVRPPADNRVRNSDQLLASTVNDLASSGMDSQVLVYKKVLDTAQQLLDWNLQSVEIPVPVPIGVTLLFKDRADGDVELKGFFKLKGMALRSNANIVVDGDDQYIERTEVGSTTAVERKKLNASLRYLKPGDKGYTLLVPISKSTYRLLNTIFDILFWVILIAIIWIPAYVIVTVLRNIAEGNHFLPENARWLSFLGWTILIVSICSFLIPFLVRIIFLQNIPNEVYYPIWTSANDVKWGLLAGIAIIMTAKAFKKGYQIKKLQDLTI